MPKIKILHGAVAVGATIIVVVVGVYLTRTGAQSFAAFVDPENGAVSNAIVINDPAASGGRAVQFGSGAPSSPPPVANASVNFGQQTYALDTFSVGATISTFSGGGVANIDRSDTWKQGLQALGPLTWRIPLRYNGGNPGSAASGAQSSGDAQTYIQNIKAIGGVPVVVVGGDAGDNTFSNSDAAGLVHYFNDNGGQHGGPVKSWVIGNEYSNGGNDPIGYQAHLAGWAAAMKAADPTIKLSAPAAPDFKYADTLIHDSVNNAAQYLDYLSYHGYQGASAGLGSTADYENYANTFRSEYINTQHFGNRASQVNPGLEEFNWAPSSGSTGFYDWHNTVFIASVVGHSLSAGAHAYEYADSAGPLGLMNDGSGQNAQPGSLYSKFPAYWGLGMWTGLNGTFRRFGDHMVQSSSSIANVEIYATNNKKVMVINKDTVDHSMTIALSGQAVTGTYSVWQTNKSQPLSAPTEVMRNASYGGGIITVIVPAGTVSSLEM